MSPCTYEEISVEKILEHVQNFIDGENVDYTEKIEEFKRIGTETLDRIIAEIEK